MAVFYPYPSPRANTKNLGKITYAKLFNSRAGKRDGGRIWKLCGNFHFFSIVTVPGSPDRRCAFHPHPPRLRPPLICGLHPSERARDRHLGNGLKAHKGQTLALCWEQQALMPLLNDSSHLVLYGPFGLRVRYPPHLVVAQEGEIV